jgi:hypothetical protein
MAAVSDDVVVVGEDAVREPVVAHELPDVLDRIELERPWLLATLFGISTRSINA